MVTTRFTPRSPLQRGTSLIEVLVTLVILSIGLLGLAGLQSRLQVSELEAYQRAQALILLDDMASRIAANRTVAFTGAYVTAGYAPGSCPTSTATQQQLDAVEWCNALQGAAENSGGNVGAMVGGRGCVTATGVAGEYLVTVAWQGLTQISVPAATCGQNLYGNDLTRRTVTTIVNTAPLS